LAPPSSSSSETRSTNGGGTHSPCCAQAGTSGDMYCDGWGTYSRGVDGTVAHTTEAATPAGPPTRPREARAAAAVVAVAEMRCGPPPWGMSYTRSSRPPLGLLVCPRLLQGMGHGRLLVVAVGRSASSLTVAGGATSSISSSSCLLPRHPS
jgi:hypothetical protein